MQTTSSRIKKILKEKNLTIYKLGKKINFSSGALHKMLHGKSSFSQNAIEKLLPILEISKEELEIWILADKYSREVIELAVKNRKEFPYKRKRLLTTKIDEILREKYMSRTNLAMQIKYGQSGLNRMITGKIGMSASVLKKISEALEIPQDEILSWIVADSYSLGVLEAALAEK